MQKNTSEEIHGPVQKIRIRCSNQRKWRGIEISNRSYAVHRLGKMNFTGLACETVLQTIFRDDKDALRVELMENGALIEAEGDLEIKPVDHLKRRRGEPILVPYDHRTQIQFEGFTLKIEAA